MKEKLVSFYIKTFSLPLLLLLRCTGVEKSGVTRVSRTLGTLVILTSATETCSEQGERTVVWKPLVAAPFSAMQSLMGNITDMTWCVRSLYSPGWLQAVLIICWSPLIAQQVVSHNGAAQLHNLLPAQRWEKGYWTRAVGLSEVSRGDAA